MRSTYALSLLASITATTAEQLTITSLSTVAPTDNLYKETNYYEIQFDITSSSGCGDYDASCYAKWNANSGLSDSLVSDSAPYWDWLQCSSRSNQTSSSNQTGKIQQVIAFQLQYPFAIGNFSIAFRQNYTICSGCSYTADSAEPFQLTNTTSAYTCQIDPRENPANYTHAGGSCSTPSNFTGFDIALDKANPLDCAAPVALSFPVLERTVWGDNVFVVGNIDKLGKWDPYNAVALNADSYTDLNNLWTGGSVIGSNGQPLNDVIVNSGTTFEYKYIEWTKNGTVVWECGENRVFTVPDDRTNQAIVGDNPNVFRCGNH